VAPLNEITIIDQTAFPRRDRAGEALRGGRAIRGGTRIIGRLISDRKRETAALGGLRPKNTATIAVLGC
jgi:hypothetical protein